MICNQSDELRLANLVFPIATPIVLFGVGTLGAEAALADPFQSPIAVHPIAQVFPGFNSTLMAPVPSSQPSPPLAVELELATDPVPSPIRAKVPQFEPDHTEKMTAIAPSRPVVSEYFSSQLVASPDPSIQREPLPLNSPAQTAPIDGAQTTHFETEASALSEVSLTTEIDTPASLATPAEEAVVVSQITNDTVANPWRFVLEPYVYLPLETSGDVTIRDIKVPYEYSLGDILESLTFAFYGRFEAWKGPWALVFDSYYFNTVESDRRDISTASLPPGLLPPQITQVPVDGTVETAFLKLDFAGAYRFGDGNLANALSTAETEFDLGPFIFDAIAGLRLYSFSNDIELTSSLGVERDFSRSDTFVEPMMGGRARWNMSDNLAAIAAATVSGFGIGTDLSVEGYAGVDWLFSGNTSLTATYRLTYIDYTEGRSGFNLFQHGPTVGVKLRF